MIYNKNILPLNKGGISSDSRKFWIFGPMSNDWLLFAALKFTQ